MLGKIHRGIDVMFCETRRHQRGITSAVAIAAALSFALRSTAPAFAGQNPCAVVEPVFEVASVKRNNRGTLDDSFQWMPQGLTIVNYTLLRLIETAYDAHDFQIAGAQNWLTTDRFDINAKASNESKPTRDEIRLMLQALLRERFGLVVKRETRTASIYNLVVAQRDGKLGGRLTPADVDCRASDTPAATLKTSASSRTPSR